MLICMKMMCKKIHCKWRKGKMCIMLSCPYAVIKQNG